MIKFKLILYVISLFPWSCIATQYLYPVAFKNEHIYCIYQSSAEVIRMVIWDSCAKEIMPGLLPRFMPAGLHLLPNKCGYSFIDEGILHIQKFSKRSPKSLEFYAPIYDINVPEWIDENTGFFTAKVRDHYGIFQFDMNADLACLLINPKKDFMYPQKVGSQLFYIERLKRGLGFQFRLMAIPYPTNVGMQGDNETIVFNSLLSDQLATEILDFHNEPINRNDIYDRLLDENSNAPVDAAKAIGNEEDFNAGNTKEALFQKIKSISDKAENIKRIIEYDMIDFCSSRGRDMSNIMGVLQL